jgi:subtilisin family serine protease
MDAYLQAVQDGVDILNLSVGPNSPPTATRTTFLNPFDAALLSAVKAGVFVAQAAGNGGPFPKTLVSYSPWITTVAAGVDDRRYKNHLILGNGKVLLGLGVSRKFFWSIFQQTYVHLYSLSFTYNRTSQNEIE